ncbi:hypothetical protein JW824_11015 [bacterium]|nr:hypothetical protein [bacterium]
METEPIQQRKSRHDALAPFWAIGLVLLCGTGLSTIWIDLGSFWKGYVLDMTGPAWNYILFRTLYRSEMNNRWTRFFTPTTTIFLFVIVCFGIEGAQYFKLYDATYDPWDFLAYVSILIPLFLLDLFSFREKMK